MSTTRQRHEPTDAEPRLAGLIAGAVAGGIALALLVAWAILAAGGRPGAARLGPAGLFAHGPDERTSIQEEWPKVEAQTRLHLETYGWVDRPAGVVRIPIERAMARLAVPGGTP